MGSAPNHRQDTTRIRRLSAKEECCHSMRCAAARRACEARWTLRAASFYRRAALFFLITKSASFFKNKRGRFSPTFHTLGLLGPKYFLKMQASRALMPKYWRQSIGGVSGWDFWRMSVSGTFDQGFYGPGCAAEAGPFFQNRRPKKQILSQKQISWPRGPVKHSTRIFGVEYFFPLQL